MTIDLHLPGAKDDSAKWRAHLVLGAFANALKEVSRVGTFGAQKYTPYGWVTVPNAHERYLDAFLRHYLAFAAGEVNDPESGLSHLAHAAWNILAVIELIKREQIASVKVVNPV